MTPACDCPAHNTFEPHDETAHATDCGWAKGIAPAYDACGGCWGCLAAQASYWARLSEGGTDAE